MVQTILNVLLILLAIAAIVLVILYLSLIHIIIYTDIVLRTLIFHDIICAEYPPDTLADSVSRFQLDNQRVHLKRLPAEGVFLSLIHISDEHVLF